MEKNYAGFKDKQALMTKAGYDEMLSGYVRFSKLPYANEHCLLIITQYLSQFRDHHVSVRAKFDATKIDSSYFSSREIFHLSPERISELKTSNGREGIYDFHDPSKYKIAVIKDKSPLRDYVGIIVSSNLPGWKPGMIKWEGKMVNDSVARGVLYMLNGMPKPESFFFEGDMIYGDWHREGSTVHKSIPDEYEPVAFRQLSKTTAYLKISTFDLGNLKNIDSIVKANEKSLATTPNLIIDVRDNGGGGDDSYTPLMNLIATGPIKTIGADLLATKANADGWKNLANDEDIPASEKQDFLNTAKLLEANQGKWVLKSTDGYLAGYTIRPYPKKVAILVNSNSASSTEQLLLEARQSKKVIVMGQNSSGTLDYSNWVEAPFLCMPYVLRYSTSRSRRLNVGNGINETGIKPKIYLDKNEDWISSAQKVLER